MLGKTLVGLALGFVVVSPAVRAQERPDSLRQERDDTTRRDRFRIRLGPGGWRFQHRFPGSFGVLPRVTAIPHFQYAPRIRWRSIPGARFDLRGWREPFYRFELGPRVGAGDLPGFSWRGWGGRGWGRGRDLGRYRTI